MDAGNFRTCQDAVEKFTSFEKDTATSVFYTEQRGSKCSGPNTYRRKSQYAPWWTKTRQNIMGSAGEFWMIRKQVNAPEGVEEGTTRTELQDILGHMIFKKEEIINLRQMINRANTREIKGVSANSTKSMGTIKAKLYVKVGIHIVHSRE